MSWPLVARVAGRRVGSARKRARVQWFTRERLSDNTIHGHDHPPGPPVLRPGSPGLAWTLPPPGSRRGDLRQLDGKLAELPADLANRLGFGMTMLDFRLNPVGAARWGTLRGVSTLNAQALPRRSPIGPCRLLNRQPNVRAIKRRELTGSLIVDVDQEVNIVRSEDRPPRLQN
jgi:hypothetical protein